MTEQPKKGIRDRLIAETKTYLLVATYLAIFLAAFTNYRRLVLREYQVGYFEFGFSIIEALILGKLIVIGRVMGIGERFRDWPLIIPTLYKTFCFSVLVVLFNVGEHMLVGLWHGEDAHALVKRVLSPGKWEILSRVVMFVTAFAPLFATWEVGREMGEGRLFHLFFRRRGSNPTVPALRAE